MGDDELLEPISLSGETGSKRESSSRFRGGWLMLLLGVWTVGVYGFLGRNVGEVAGPPPPPRMDVEEGIEIGLEENGTDLSTPIPTLEPQDADRVRVVSDPPAATVLLDGEFVGMTPLEMDRPVAGQQLALRKSGYEPLQVIEDMWDKESDVKLKLKPITGRVRISVSPPQTTLWLNGTELDLPVDGVVELPLRRHRIKAVASGYEVMEIDVLPAMAYERRIRFELKTE